MPLIRFVDAGGVLLAEADAAPGDLLLDVARLCDVPLHWRCGQGTCGTCKVRVTPAGEDGEVMLSGKERNVMLRAGLVSAEQARQAVWSGLAGHWRLACHLTVGADDWQVLCPQD